MAFRYPRGSGIGVPISEIPRVIPFGKAEILQEGTDLLILAIGQTVYDALAAAKILATNGVSCTVVNSRFVKPLDDDLIRSLAAQIPRIITVEDNIRQGGFGSAVLECLNDGGIQNFRLERIGVADVFVEHGPQKLLRAKYGLDKDGIVRAAHRLLEIAKASG